MKEALIEIISKNLTQMGVPDYAKSTVIVQALSKLSADLGLPVEPFSLDNFSSSARELIEETAAILIKSTSHVIMREFIVALTAVANDSIISKATEEAKNAVLM